MTSQKEIKIVILAWPERLLPALMFPSQVEENIVIWIGTAQGERALAQSGTLEERLTVTEEQAGTDLLPRQPWGVERQLL